MFDICAGYGADQAVFPGTGGGGWLGYGTDERDELSPTWLFISLIFSALIRLKCAVFLLVRNSDKKSSTDISLSKHDWTKFCR